MALRDYSILDEQDFYGQAFEREGFVSVWTGIGGFEDAPANLDVLQDLCGVGYYSLDKNEGVNEGYAVRPIRLLLSQLSYSDSFLDSAAKAARAVGHSDVRWVVAQYDFAYDPRRVKRPLSPEAVFLGVFRYAED